MKLKFDLKDKQNVNIINEEDGRIVGRIFTPSGTGRDKPDAIQVCGFSRAFEFWGCGGFGDNEGKPLQDIQLLFKDFKSKTGTNMKGNGFASKPSIMNKNGCDRCFHWKDNAGNCKCPELKVFRRFEDIAKYEKRRKSYEQKVGILENLNEKEKMSDLFK